MKKGIILPNKVSLSILLHWIAKERSELSNMVIKSSSTAKKKQTKKRQENSLYGKNMNIKTDLFIH